MSSLPSVDIDTAVTSEGVQCSHGTAALLNTIYQWSLIPQHKQQPYVNGVFINILTILRNVYSTFRDTILQVNPKTILSWIRTDVDQLMYYFDSYVSLQALHTQPKVYIYLYIPNYTSIPQEIRKKLTKADTDLLQIFKKVYPLLSKEFTSVSNSRADMRSLQGVGIGRLEIYRVITEQKRLPHFSLFTLASEKDHQLSYGDYYLISHVPADYHLISKISKMKLMRSHTGALVMSQQLGNIVFKHEHVPFNRYTHFLLGDRKMTSCIVTKTVKENILELAQKDRWQFKTSQYIMQKLLMLNYYSYEYDKINPY